MFNHNKVILCDIDGVVFDWHSAFVNWMEMQGYESTGITHHDADIHLEFESYYLLNLVMMLLIIILMCFMVMEIFKNL